MTSTSQVVSITSGQTDDLEAYAPNDTSEYLASLDVFIEFHDGESAAGVGLFRIVVCTPRQLFEMASRYQPCIMLSGYLVVDQYDWALVKSIIMKRFHMRTADSTADLMIEFSGYAAYAD